MTAPNHIIQSGLIQYFVYPKWYLIVIAMLLGALPDLVHLLDNKGDWTIYNKFHEHKLYKWFLPYLNLHLLEDWLTHKKEGGWKSWAYPVEVTTDFIMAFIIFLIIRGKI